MLRKFYISTQSSIRIMCSNMLIATVDDKRERKEPRCYRARIPLIIHNKINEQVVA